MGDPAAPHATPARPVMSVRTAAVWAMAGQYLSFAIQFAGSVIISRFFLDPAELGLFSIALAAAMLVAIVQDFGLSRYISGLPELDGPEIARCSSVSFAFSFVVAGIIAALAFPLASLYGHPALAPILLIVAGSYLFVPLSVVPMAMMARGMRFGGHFAVNVASALVQATVAIGLAAAGYSSFALAWGTVALAASRGIIAQIAQPALPWPPRFDRLGPVLRFGGKSSGLYLTGAIGSRSPELLVGKLLSLAATGLYSRAASLADQIRMLLSGAIGGVFFPAFARIRDRGEPLGPAYLRVCAGFSAIVWPGMAGLSLAAEPLVRMLYGPDWLGVAPLLSIIALTEIFLIALPLVSDLPIVMGRIERLLALNLVDTALSIALLAVGTVWGVEGAAASRLVYAVLWLAIYWRFMQGIVGFDVRALAAIYARSGGAMLAALAPLALAYAFWAPPAKIGFGALGVAVSAGVLTWGAALVALRHPAVDEFAGLAAGLPVPVGVRVRVRAALGGLR